MLNPALSVYPNFFSTSLHSFFGFGDTAKDVVFRQARLKRELKLALQRQEFQLYYQLQHSIQDQQLTGVEVLIRWALLHEGGV